MLLKKEADAKNAEAEAAKQEVGTANEAYTAPKYSSADRLRYFE